MNKFAIDKLLIFSTFKCFSQKNQALISKKYKEILNIDERFLIQEPDWKNPQHLGKMIIICNIIEADKNLKKNLPFYFQKHSSYLQDTFPEYLTKEKENGIENEKMDNNIDLQKFYELIISQSLERDDSNFSETFEFAKNIAEKGLNSEDKKNRKVMMFSIFEFFLKLIEPLNKIIKNFQNEYLYKDNVDVRLLIRIIMKINQFQSKIKNKDENLKIFLIMSKFVSFILIPYEFLKNQKPDKFETNKFLKVIEILTIINDEFEEFLTNNLIYDDIFQKNAAKINNLLFIFTGEILKNPEMLNKFSERKRLK